MSRNPQPKQQSNGSGREPLFREATLDGDRDDRDQWREDDVYAHRARNQHDPRSDDGRKDEGYGEGDGDDRDALVEDRRGRVPARDNRDEEDIVIDTDIDIMEQLDQDDLIRMDGPDA